MHIPHLKGKYSWFINTYSKNLMNVKNPIIISIRNF